jgi:nitrate/nitrite-specific signal transduction histidine kinase
MNQTFLLSVEDALSYRITGKLSEKEAYYKKAQEFETLLEDLKNVLGYGTAEIPAEDIPLIEGLVEHWDAFKTETEAYFLLAEQGSSSSSTIPEAEIYIEHIDGLVEILTQYMELEKGEIEEAHTEINNTSDATMEQIAGIGLLVVFITLISNITVLMSIINPLAHLGMVVENFGKGELQKRANIKGKNEFSTLAKGFNEMADNIEKSQVTLEQKVNKRTAELQTKFKEIEEMNTLMIGREVKMIELKKEIEELKKKQIV